MYVIRATRCVRCGRGVRGLPEARKEGGLSFCSQSCYLQHVSTATHAGRHARKDVASHPARGAAVGGIRLVGKTIKWVLILVVLATTAFVIAVVVAITHALDSANKAADRADANSRRAAGAYATIKYGTTMAQVRRRLGQPDDASADKVSGVREECWYFGSVFSSSGKEYEFCFRRGKLYSKSRL
jgi:hypothetical protein